MKIEKLLTNISDEDIKDGVLIIPDGVTMLLDHNVSYLSNVWFAPDEAFTTNDDFFFEAKTIEIPESVTTIDESWFTGCKGLTDIKVDKNNAVFCDIDGVLFSKDKTELLYFPHGKKETKYKIPEGTVDIGYGAFTLCKVLTDIIIPYGVRHIGSLVFSGCSSMKSIEIPNSVTEIGSVVFGQITIKCHRGSAAEKYAKNHKY